jgi:hypothetical protein
MLEQTRQNWQKFKESEPGHRFEDRYSRRQESEHGWLDPRRLFYLVGGLIIAVGSLLFGVLPGPGTLTFFLGLGMIAGEFRPVARLLDWAEVKARKLGRWARYTWKLSVAGKVLLIVVALAIIALVGYGAYYLLFGS